MSPMEFIRLQEELQRRDEELNALHALLRVSHNITTTLQLEPLLGVILDQLKEVVGYRLASISVLEKEDELLLLAVRGDGMPQPGTRFQAREGSNTWEILRRRGPSSVPDLNADTPLAQRMRENLASQNLTSLGSWMSAPLVIRDQSIGLLALAHPEVDYYNPARVNLAMAFANQSAIAIANARLYEQGQHLAALEERQKLARELHDSVSQALYGIVLGARTARTLLDHDASKAAEPMDYILSLAEAGLAEMRALIFELRPESLQTEGLVAALGKLVNALGARYQFKVQLEAGAEPDIPIEVKESLYRITQEALNNITKHAHAHHVNISLKAESDGLALNISDDGAGFDMSQSFPGHLGLYTMRERAEKAGGTIALDSAPYAGTRILVRIPSVRG